jgi:hypothetical protein
MGQDYWVVARPVPDTNVRARLRAAWEVFRGRAEAVRFCEHPMDVVPSKPFVSSYKYK